MGDRLARTDRLDQRGRLGHRGGDGPAVCRGRGERRRWSTSMPIGRETAGRASSGERRSFIQADVSVEEQVRDSLAKTVARFGGLNIIVNCAGLVHVKLLHEYDEADWDRLMGVNLKSIFFSVKHGVQYLRRQPAELRGERRVDQQLRRPGRDAGLHGLEVGRARADPFDRARLCRDRPPLQLRLPGDHRHADVARAPGQDARPRGDPGRTSAPRSDASAAAAR